MRKKFFRKPLALLLALVCMMSVSVQAFAASDETVVSEEVEAVAIGEEDEVAVADEEISDGAVIARKTFTNNMTWTGGNNDVLVLTKTMRRLRYQGTFNLFGTHGVVVLNFDLLDSNGNVVDGRSYTFACNGSTYTSDDFLYPWPAGRYRVKVAANTTKNLNTLFINFES